MTRKGSAVFLDTTIQIARKIHSPPTKKRIAERIKSYDLTVTGQIVRQEFKRRFLKDARYLLDLFKRYKSYKDVMHHVVDVLTSFHQRKQKICLELLATFFPEELDEDLTDRSILLLKALLEFGLDEFDSSVGHVVRESGCSLAEMPVKKTRSGYDLGKDRCSGSQDCEVAKFLSKHKSKLEELLTYLSDVEDKAKSDEIRHIEAFIGDVLKNPDSTSVQLHEPCKTVGDLLIALESTGIPSVYTMNGKESQHLCRVMSQDLIVRSTNPDHEDVVCSKGDTNWPKF